MALSGHFARSSAHSWTLGDSYTFISHFLRRYQSSNAYPAYAGLPAIPLSRPCSRLQPSNPCQSSSASPRREFHDYFVSYLPLSSLHPDSQALSLSQHRQQDHVAPAASTAKHLRSSSGGAVPGTSTNANSAPDRPIGVSRDTTVVRIPLRSARHHFGVAASRGTRPYNEDMYQAGVIDIPAFSRRTPRSLTLPAGGLQGQRENRVADSANGDPQVFYFGVFDGHGGVECSEFLRDSLHDYIQEAAAQFMLQSSLKKKGGQENISQEQLKLDRTHIAARESELVKDYNNLVGGYYRRFRPEHFAFNGEHDGVVTPSTMEEVLEYAFLKADFDFVAAQAAKADGEDIPFNHTDVLSNPSQSPRPIIGGPRRFKGGSTASIAMISTPTATPFWSPATPSTVFVSHVGDTRVILCETTSGSAIPLTANHHPSSVTEQARLRRYAASFVTDSFGEERISGLANTRSFGDISSKRLGVSAEPQMTRMDLTHGAEYAFIVLASDGVTGVLPDQELVDIIKEAKTPTQGARDVVEFAVECADGGADADNATCLVVRLGGWERRQEGGLGSLGTREARDWRRHEAATPRNRT